MRYLLAVVLLSIGCLGQSTTRKEPDVKELAVSIKAGESLPLTHKKLEELVLADLPDATADPLSLETTFKCQTLEAIAIANEQQHGELGRMVPQDVLEHTTNTAFGCLALETSGMENKQINRVGAAIATAIDANLELDQRRYNKLVDRFNELLTATRSLQNQLVRARGDASEQRRINNALAIYSLMPKYHPPQLMIYQLSTHTSCTSRTIGTTVYT